VVQDIARRVPSKAGAKTSAVYDWNQAIMDFMSAVLRGTDRHGTDDPLLVRYVREFPARAKTQEKKKAAVPFRQSNRYFRGRIIDLLRERKSVPQRILYPRFQELGKDRFIQILHGLERDGLILVQKEHIVLP